MSLHVVNSMELFNELNDRWEFAVSHRDKFDVVRSIADTLLNLGSVQRRNAGGPPAGGALASETLKNLCEALICDEKLLVAYKRNVATIWVDCSTRKSLYDVYDREIVLYQQAHQVAWRGNAKQSRAAEILGAVAFETAPPLEQEQYINWFEIESIVNVAEAAYEFGQIFSAEYRGDSRVLGRWRGKARRVDLFEERIECVRRHLHDYELAGS